MRSLSLALVALCLGCVSGRPSLRSQTTLLEPGQSMEQVRKALGGPDAQTGAMCGEAVGRPFKCMVWEYFGSTSTLSVRFQHATAESPAWAVNTWDWQ